MLLGKYSISKHAISQYEERVGVKKNNKDIIKCIKMDLRTMNIRNIIYKGEQIHVFTYGKKEFVFEKRPNLLLLKTVVKRNIVDTQNRIKTVQKRKSLVTNK